MAAGDRSSPRSIADATRFTSNTPHASTKSTPSVTTGSRSSSSPNVASQTAPRRSGTSSIPHETMEQRVRRLRAAHLAAKQHSVSRLDNIIAGSRRFFDAAHKFTVMGLIGFSGIALLVTVYATADMAVHNRKRRNEFLTLQKQLKEDSLEAARLAYMTGTASEEQISLVEDATAKAKQAGVSLPPLLSAPRPAAPPRREGDAGAGAQTATAERTVWPGESMVESNLGGVETSEKRGGITSWLFGGLKKGEVGVEDTEKTLSPSDQQWNTNAAPAAGDVGGALRNKAKAAFEHERDNQRRGGPLDQVGLDTTASNAVATAAEGTKKKGWLW
ncbi:hypothetical protein GGS20DRAFT_295601 [Poronia punctata]|nr:hypothetical protein GGS20DRAFT_295601 [Poronia punctata]